MLHNVYITVGFQTIRNGNVIATRSALYASHTILTDIAARVADGRWPDGGMPERIFTYEPGGWEWRKENS